MSQVDGYISPLDKYKTNRVASNSMSSGTMFGNTSNTFDLFDKSTPSLTGSDYLDNLNSRINTNSYANDSAFQTTGSATSDFFKKEGFGVGDKESSFLGSPEFANSLKALEAFGGLSNVFLGYKGLQLAKDQFKHNKKFDLFNANNQVSAYNSNLDAKVRQANALSSNAVSKERHDSMKLEEIKV